MGFLSSISGGDQADAARKAAQSVVSASIENQNRLQYARDQGQSDYQPHFDTERTAALQLNQLLANGFNDTPLSKAILNEAMRDVGRQYGAAGKFYSGQALEDIFNRSGTLRNQLLNDQFSRLYNASRPNATNALNQLRLNTVLGQNSERMTGAEAFGAGEIGAANARAAGIGNLINMGTSLAAAIPTGGLSLANMGGTGSPVGSLYRTPGINPNPFVTQSQNQLLNWTP